MANLEELGCVIYEALVNSSLETDKTTFLQKFTTAIFNGHIDVIFEQKLVQFRADFLSGNLYKVSLYATSPFSLVDTALVTQNLRQTIRLDA